MKVKGEIVSFKKLPYGQSNFADLIKSGYAYVDKTRFIELLENENNRYQFFIRPRRFGKSLFLSVLENYYDFNKKHKFKDIFGNLYIGKHATSEQGTYAIMQFDFSGLSTDIHDEFKTSFSNKIQNAVQMFLERYKNIIPDANRFIDQAYEEKIGIGAMDIAYKAIAGTNISIFVIIDEYDHFANNFIAMGKTYKDEVKSGGIVRTFYESLKTGTKSIIRRIFITGISPMMINDLTSGFNMSTDYSLFPKYNEMLGFTRDEVEWLMQETGIDKSLIKVDMETYYNGYMFNKNGKNRVYNSQMILYLFNQILQLGEQPKDVVDTNLQTDYERLRRLAENENNREKLFQIIKDNGIFAEVIEKFSIDKINSEEYFISLLFYLGMLTNSEIQKGRNWLKIPNYSIKTLYWEYAVSYTQDSDKKAVSVLDLSGVISRMAYDGDFKSYLDFFTENFLKRLSNRDLTNFDEKYIKVMLLSTLFISHFYLPVSEDENINGYTDIHLQKHPSLQDIKFEYIFEVKYIKAGMMRKEKNIKLVEASVQIEKYKKDVRFANRDDIKFVALIFEGKGNYEAKEI
jgi:hypothetical protein